MAAFSSLPADPRLPCPIPLLPLSSSIEIFQSKAYAHYAKGVAGTAGFLGLISGLDIGLGRCVRLTQPFPLPPTGP